VWSHHNKIEDVQRRLAAEELSIQKIQQIQHFQMNPKLIQMILHFPKFQKILLQQLMRHILFEK
jgi:hypothetical protein